MMFLSSCKYKNAKITISTTNVKNVQITVTLQVPVALNAIYVVLPNN